MSSEKWKRGKEGKQKIKHCIIDGPGSIHAKQTDNL